MRKLQCWFSILVASIGFASFSPAAEISWSPAFEIETDADIDISNEIVRAVNVVNPDIGEVEVEFPGGVTVEFEPEHTFEFNSDLDEEFFSNGHVTGDGNFYSGQDEALTTENPDLDRVLDSHGWAGAGPGSGIAVLELTDLAVGTDYQIQLVGAADDRGCCEYRQMEIWNSDLEPVTSNDGEEFWFGRSNDFDQDDERGPGSSIGTFTADADTQQILLVGTADFDDGNENFGNGNDPGLSMYVLSLASVGDPCDFDGSGTLDVGDVNMIAGAIQGGANPADFDLTGDGLVNFDDLNAFVTGENKLHTWIGDANLDGEFNSTDFVNVFQAGQYEDGVAANSTWTTGDWNGDGEFDSSDFVVAFQDGGFELGPRWQGDAVASVPEPSSIVLLLLGAFALFHARRSR